MEHSREGRDKEWENGRDFKVQKNEMKSNTSN